MKKNPSILSQPGYKQEYNPNLVTQAEKDGYSTQLVKDISVLRKGP